MPTGASIESPAAASRGISGSRRLSLSSEGVTNLPAYEPMEPSQPSMPSQYRYLFLTNKQSFVCNWRHTFAEAPFDTTFLPQLP